MTDFVHETVLLNELVRSLNPSDGRDYVDCTLGGGGHAEAVLLASHCRVFGVDRDPAALQAASERLARFGDRFVPVRGSFSELTSLLQGEGVERVDGIYADLGVSSPQLDHAVRGFSFRRSGPIDMRMDPDGPLTGADVVNTWSEAELLRILWTYGEERRARRVVRTILADRPWTDTVELADAIARVVGKKERKHPATRSFQAIRIAVNDELGELERLLSASPALLSPGGRLCVISFHSLEDRIVKRFLADQSGKNAPKDPYGDPIGTFPFSPPRRSITPSASDPNPRARSSRLRSAVRLP